MSDIQQTIQPQGAETNLASHDLSRHTSPSSSVSRTRAAVKTEAAIIVLFFLITLVMRSSAFFRSVLDWDESLYFLIAENLRHGVLPYTAEWDHKPVGIYVVFALAQWLFGDHIIAIRLAGVIAVTASAYLIFRLARSLMGNNSDSVFPTSLLAGFLYILYTLTFDGIASNTEIFYSPFVCGTLLLVLSAPVEAPLGRLLFRSLLIGLVMGLALQIKYVVIFELGLFGLLFLGRTFQADQFSEKPRHECVKRTIVAGIVVISGALLPFLVVASVYLAAGQIDTFFYANFGANLQHSGADWSLLPFLKSVYRKIREQFPLYLATALLAGKLASDLLSRRRSVSRADRSQWTMAAPLVLAWTIAAIAGSSITGRYYAHYDLQVLPPLCIGTALVMKLFLDNMAISHGFKLGAIALFLAQPIGSIATNYLLASSLQVGALIKGTQVQTAGLSREVTEIILDTPAQVSQMLRSELSGKTDHCTVYTADYEPIIYHLVNVRPPTKYVFPPFLIDTHFAHVARVNVAEELKKIIEKKPEFIVRAASPLGNNTEFYETLNEALRTPLGNNR
jgi:4-amino-4-deoxy-L-arabinose transferase-like glycosyltransferase